MKILNIKVLRGPNFWSNSRQKLIVFKLDLQEYENFPSNLLPGFAENLAVLIPSLNSHRCSVGTEGGFLQRLKEGTWLGHIVEHVALELQTLAGMDCGFGRTRETYSKGIYHVVFNYEIESAGILAGKIAVKLVECLANSKPYLSLNEDINNLKRIQIQEGLGTSTRSIVDEAQKRNIPWTRLDSDSLVRLGQGCNQKLVCATVSCQTCTIGVDLASDKNSTKNLLASALVPVPNGVVIAHLEELEEAIAELGFPIVIKPSNSNHGRGITTRIFTKEKAEIAYKIAKKISSKIIVEQFICGSDYRFLLVNYKVAAIAKRKPAAVIGDGISTIQELIDEVNQDPQRGEGHENILTKIKIDETTLAILLDEELNLETVLPPGKEVFLKHAANISTGGTAIDVTDEVHPDNIFLAERVARLMNLDICGIDIVTENINFPVRKNNGAVLEVNACPGLRMHLAPTEGKSRNVAKNIIDMLYPPNVPTRIPIIAVTGTNGKTTTVRLIAHLASQAGYQVGMTTTEGIYINNKEIYRGDCSGPNSAEAVLRDSLVNFAVLETARGGILRAGLGFDHCDISIVTNISEDHLGLDDIETLEDLTQVKKVVPLSTFPNGYAILNADDDLVYAIKKDLICNVALFSMDADSPRIEAHCLQGGLAAYLDKEEIIIRKGEIKTLLTTLTEIPITYFGKAPGMTQNILAAVLAGIISNFKSNNISEWLKNFFPTFENTPGRMNLFVMQDIQILMDYAHNVSAFIELKKYLNHVKCNKIVGIISAPGDRRDEDIINTGYYSAQLFDETIIRHDKDGRGRTKQQITALIKQGIAKYNPEAVVSVISDEKDALKFALQNAKLGTFIVYCPENALEAIDYLNQSVQHRLRKASIL